MQNKTITYSDILEKELKDAILSFQLNYNAANPDSPETKFILKLNEIKLNSGEFIKKAAITLEYKELGYSEIIISKTFHFRHKREVEDRNFWLTKMYREVFAELIGLGLSLIDMKVRKKRIIEENLN